MPTITFLPVNKKVEVPEDTLLFTAALDNGLPVASSCSAQSVCGKCNMEVVEGGENLTPQKDWEKDLLRRQGKPQTDRVSCITRVRGNCSVKTSYW